MIRRSRVVIVICPSLEDTVQAIDPEARVVLIENAPGSAEDAATPAQAADVRARSGWRLDDAGRALHRHVRSLPGPRPALRRDGRRQARRVRTRVWSLPAGSRIRLSVRGSRPARPASRRRRSSPASARPPRSRRICSPRILLVSPRSRGTNTPLKIYQYLRSGKAIVATRLLTHTQVLSDETAILTEATPQAFAAGILAGLADRAMRGRRRPARARPRRDQIQLRRLSRADTPGLPGADARRIGASTGRGGRRTSRDGLTPRRALQLLDVCGSRRWPAPSTSAGSAGRSAIWSRGRRRACSPTWSGASRIATSSTSAPAPAGWRCCSRTAPQRSPAIDASEEMLAIARKRAADELVKVRFERGDAHALDFPDRSFDAVVSLPPADARAAVAAVPGRDVPRIGSAGDHRLPVGDERRVVRVVGAAAGRRRRRQDRGVSRLQPRHHRRRARRERLPDPIDAPPVRAADRVSQADRLAPLHDVRSRTSSTASACSSRSARRSRSSPNGACPRLRRNGVHRRSPRARAGGAWRHRLRARPCARRTRGGARTIGRRHRARAISATRQRSPPRPKASTSSTTSPRCTGRRAFRMRPTAPSTPPPCGRSSKRRPGAGRSAWCTAARLASTATSSIRLRTKMRRSKPGDIYQETKLEGEALAREAGARTGHRGDDRAAQRHLRPGRSPPAEAVSSGRARPLDHARLAARSITI